MSSLISVIYNSPSGNVNITNFVLWADTAFQASAGAVPGSATIACRDMDQVLTFVTGREVSLSVDGQLLWAGYIRNIGYKYGLEADLIDDADTYPKRMFELECVDFNVLFDKRVIRWPSDYTEFELPKYTGSTNDGDAIKYLIANYIDWPAGFDYETEVENIGTVAPDSSSVMYESQGVYLRDQLKTFAAFTAPVYYISPDKKLVWKGLESVIKPWGFSDQPNNATISGSGGFESAYYGFRGCVASEDGSPIINDSLLWGGSTEGSDANVIFARYQDSVTGLTQTSTTYVQSGSVVPDSSIDLHGRWQIGQIKVNDGASSPYGNMAGVKEGAKQVIYGPPGGNELEVLRGLRYSQWNFKFSWLDDNVPMLGGTRNHIQVGDLVTVQMNSFGLERLLPCRQLSIRAEGVDENGLGILRFEGEFALSIEDPWQLWQFLLARAKGEWTSSGTITIVDNTSTTTTYGAMYQDIPSPLPNGTEDTFSIPFGYIARTLDVYLNGLLQRSGTDFIEMDGPNGVFQMSSAPTAADSLYVICYTLAS